MAAAKEKGLEPLAMVILLQKTEVPVEELATEYLDAEKEVNTVEDAIAGAMDIIAEMIADEADYRIALRDLTTKQGKMVSVAKDEEEQAMWRERRL